MLISLAEELDTSVSILLGETVPQPGEGESDIKRLSEKLEVINLACEKKCGENSDNSLSAHCIVCNDSCSVYSFGNHAECLSELGLQ